MTVYDPNSDSTSHLKRKIFLDPAGTSNFVQRFETLKYPHIDDMTEQALGFFWRPEDISCERDKRDFQEAPEAITYALTQNLLRLIMLDSIHSRAPEQLFAPVCSNPEVEAYLTQWGMFECAIHSKSYTHIIRSIYPNPSEIFDQVNQIPQILEAAKSIAAYYDDLAFWNNVYQLACCLDTQTGDWLGQNNHGRLSVCGEANDVYNRYEHKKAIWRALFAANSLEGIRFVTGFAIAFAVEQNGYYEGFASIVNLISRDELESHLKFTQYLLNKLPEDDEDFAKIRVELADEMYALFKQVVDEEKAWAPHPFAKGAIVGLNSNIMVNFIDYLAQNNLEAIGMKWLESDIKANPLPWMTTKTERGRQQKALQETDGTSYTVGLLDISENDIGSYVAKHSKKVKVSHISSGDDTEKPVNNETSNIVQVYGKKDCPKCNTLTSYLRVKNIPFAYYVLDTDYTLPVLTDMFNRLEIAMPREFPMTFLNDKLLSYQEAINLRSINQ